MYATAESMLTLVFKLYGETEDYTISIENPPACPSPSMATVPAIGIDTAGCVDAWLFKCISI